MAHKKKPAYEVGYRRPPHETQFQKGVSGNPHGRPKGSGNLAAMVERVAHELIVINENGKRRSITKLEAAAKQLTNKAASGDLKAFKMLRELMATFSAQIAEAPDQPTFGKDDKAVWSRMLKRLERQNPQ